MRISFTGLWPREGIGGLISVLSGQGMRTLEPVDSEAAQFPEAFRPHYEQKIFPRVAEFEARRLIRLQAFRLRLWIFVTVGTAILAAAGYITAEVVELEPDVVIGVTVVAVILLWWWTYSPVRRYRRSVKSEIYPDIFRYFGPDFTYQVEGQLSARSLQPSGILPGFDDETREDYVSGTYNSVGIELTEARLTEKQGSGDNRRNVEVFRGMFIRFHMNKSFAGHTVVVQDVGRVGNWLSSRFSGLERVALEDPVFEKRFEVRSSDQIEARYLLTPSFMERLLELGTLFGSRKLRCAFYDDRLLFLIESSQNRFEGGTILEPETFADEIRAILSEMPALFGIVDVLKLDEQTRL
jgi:hypothetical protein